MTTKSPFTRLALAAIVAVSAIGAIPASALADGTHPDGHGGAVCKGIGHCLVLELDCKGTYTDATQPDGTVYGKCSKTAQIAPQAKIKLRAN